MMLVVAGCGTGAAVGRPPEMPLEPLDGPLKSSGPAPAPPLSADSQTPVSSPTSGPTEPAPVPPPLLPSPAPAAYQRPDTAREPTGEAIEPSAPPKPPPVVWQRVDLIDFSAELPAPIKTGTFEDGGHWASSALGPGVFFFGEGGFQGKGAEIVAGMIKTMMANNPGSVEKHDATKWKDVVDHDVVIRHLKGSVTVATYRYVDFKSGNGGWMVWRVVSDGTGRGKWPEIDRFMGSMRGVPNGKPKPLKLPSEKKR
jgi:hypothetical protein